MIAIILAAGEWTRLRPLTYTTPKPLIPIRGKPILEHNIEKIYPFVSEIIIVVKYRKEDIINYFWDNFRGTQIRYIEQWEKKGTAAAIADIEIPDDVVMLMNGDSIFAKTDLLKVVQSHGYGCLVMEVNTPEKYGIFQRKPDGLAQKIIEKPKEYVGNLASIGVYKFDSSIIKIARETPVSVRGEYEITDAINTFLLSHAFCLWSVQGKFIDIGYIEDIKTAHKMLENAIFQKLSVWESHFLEKIEDYDLHYGIPESAIDEIVTYSKNPDDQALLCNTADFYRFSSREKIETWVGSQRYVFTLLDNYWKIAGIWWGRPSVLPEISQIFDEQLFQKVQSQVQHIHTNGVRIYPQYRGKGFWTSLLSLCGRYYDLLFPEVMMCVDINEDNLASKAIYEKNWYTILGRGENKKTAGSTWNARVLYVHFPQWKTKK